MSARLVSWLDGGRAVFLGLWSGLLLCLVAAMALPFREHHEPFYHGVLGFDGLLYPTGVHPSFVQDDRELRRWIALAAVGAFLLTQLAGTVALAIHLHRPSSWWRIVPATLAVAWPVALLSFGVLAVVLEVWGSWPRPLSPRFYLETGEIEWIMTMLVVLVLGWWTVTWWTWSDRSGLAWLGATWLMALLLAIALLPMRLAHFSGYQTGWALATATLLYTSGMLAALRFWLGEEPADLQRLRHYRRVRHRRMIDALLVQPFWVIPALALAAICGVGLVIGTMAVLGVVHPHGAITPPILDQHLPWAWLAGSGVGCAGIWLYVLLGGLKPVRRIMAAGRCPSCDYDLRGNPAVEHCPECGERVYR